MTKFWSLHLEHWFRVRSLKAGGPLLLLSLSIHIWPWQEGSCLSKACILLNRTCFGCPETYNSLSKWPQSLHRSLPQVCPPRVGCVSVCTPWGCRNRQRTAVCVACARGLIVQAGYPHARALSLVWAEKVGGLQASSLCLHVLEWNPDPKFKLAFLKKVYLWRKGAKAYLMVCWHDNLKILRHIKWWSFFCILTLSSTQVRDEPHVNLPTYWSVDCAAILDHPMEAMRGAEHRETIKSVWGLLTPPGHQKSPGSPTWASMWEIHELLYYLRHCIYGSL